MFYIIFGGGLGQSISAAAQSLYSDPAYPLHPAEPWRRSWASSCWYGGTKGSLKVILTEEWHDSPQAEPKSSPGEQGRGGNRPPDDTVVGTVSIGAGGDRHCAVLAKAARTLQKWYPDICYQISSGNAEYVWNTWTRASLILAWSLGR